MVEQEELWKQKIREQPFVRQTSKTNGLFTLVLHLPNAHRIHIPCVHTCNAECALYYSVCVRKPRPLSDVKHLAYEHRGRGLETGGVVGMKAHYG